MKALTGFFYAHCHFVACFAGAGKARTTNLNGLQLSTLLADNVSVVFRFKKHPCSSDTQTNHISPVVLSGLADRLSHPLALFLVGRSSFSRAQNTTD
jgi:hypothetical protein